MDARHFHAKLSLPFHGQQRAARNRASRQPTIFLFNQQEPPILTRVPIYMKDLNINRSRMKLRSSSSREVKISQNFDSQGGDESAVDNMNPTSKALRNPLILDLILAHLSDLTDLKRARLVCRNWAEVGASLLGKRTALNVNKLIRYDEGSKMYLVTPVAANLMRRISMLDKCDPSVPHNKVANVITKVFAELGQCTREIHCEVTYIKFVTAFFNGLRKLKKSKTNIQHISVTVWVIALSLGKEGYPTFTNKLPVQTNLTSIEFQLYDRIGGGSYAFKPLLQILLDSAPNLTSLKVCWPFYPNLQGCKNLKVFKFDLVWCAAFNVPDKVAAIGILAQVKDTLIDLELGSIADDTVDLPQSQTLDVPVMSKVVSVTISPAAMDSF
ncbi:uncharacterized protein LOC110857459 isoform X1 [Folsomia candida]|uniref:uncharacterized protein LOC110857459 isoform X1 n=2 Tax=Folsomia candida TaxID=158441 RepID=UPI001604CCAB|nr:uncharacterized protein LOC110857459 isoform X1 [Folsomia candida]